MKEDAFLGVKSFVEGDNYIKRYFNYLKKNHSNEIGWKVCNDWCMTFWLYLHCNDSLKNMIAAMNKFADVKDVAVTAVYDQIKYNVEYGKNPYQEFVIAFISCYFMFAHKGYL